MTRSNSISILPLFVVLTAIFQQHVRAENGTVVDPVNVPDVVLQNNATTVNDTISILLPKLATADEADGIPATAENAEKEDDNDMIPGQYIVFYKKNADRTFATQQRRPFRIVLELRKAVAVAGISDEQYKELLQDPSVEKVIPDYTITIESTRGLFETNQVTCNGLGGIFTQPSCGITELAQNAPANWGLDRIDQSNLPLDNVYTTRCDGARVQVYILDTGIRKSHVEFGGRATCGANFVVGEDCRDYDGHGTHVAGTVGGATFGVAKKVDLVDVKIFNRDGVGSLSALLAGIDHVVAQKNKNPSKPMVLNMSLGAVGTSMEIKQAVDEAVAAGIVVVVAAGNRGVDACNYSPAFVPNAITVGATDKQDIRPVWSNFGSCVDIHAPGVLIVSASFLNDNSATILSGTSMSAPHVAGAAALYLQSNPKWTPAQVWNAMRDDATAAVQGTNRLLLQTQFV